MTREDKSEEEKEERNIKEREESRVPLEERHACPE